jgi:hypothetical protein
MFRYFRGILVARVDGHMDHTACTPHTLPLCRTPLYRV